MKKLKTKKSLVVSIDRKIYETIEEKIKNKSKYIEWLIYQDLLINSSNDEIKKIIL